MMKMYVHPSPCYSIPTNARKQRRRYWDQTINDNAILASRTSILETIPKVITASPSIKPKSTVGRFEKFFFDIKRAIADHKILSILFLIGGGFGGYVYFKRRVRRGRGGFFRLDDKDGLLGGSSNGKVD